MAGILHTALVDMGYKWLKRAHQSAACGVVLTEYKSYASEIPDVIGFGRNFSTVIECKASYEDFKADLKKGHRQVLNGRQLGNYRFYLAPTGMIPTAEVPEKWGLLATNGKQIKVALAAPHLTSPEIKCAEYQILYSIVRRFKLRGLLAEIQKPLIAGEKLREG